MGARPSLVVCLTLKNRSETLKYAERVNQQQQQQQSVASHQFISTKRNLTYILILLCVCVFSSHSFWTSSSLDVPAGVTQEEGHTGFFIHLLSAVRTLIFLARRIQPFLSLVGREVDFYVRFNRSPPVGHFYFLFFVILVRKIPFAGIELTSQHFRGLRGTSELPGYISKVYLTYLRPYKTILLLLSVVRNSQTDKKDCGFGVPAWRLM